MFGAVLAPPNQSFGARPDAGATGLERQGSMVGSGRKVHHLELDEDERRFLREIVDGGKGSAERRKRAHVPLLADRGREGGGRTDTDID